MKYKLSVIQMESDFQNIEKNLAKAKQYVQKAIEEESKIIVLPESFIYGYDNMRIQEMIDNAITLDSEIIKDFQKIAKDNEVMLVVPTFLKKNKDSIIATNSAILISDEGEILDVFSKTHPVGKERELIKRGNTYNVIDTKYGKVGMLICYDVCFPEAARIMALKGAQLLLVPAAWRGTYYFNEWWDINLSCRAIDDLYYVAAANQIGITGDEYFAGRSKIVDPLGRTINELIGKEGMVTAEIDTDIVKKEREFNTVLIDRHPEDYEILLSEFREEK